MHIEQPYICVLSNNPVNFGLTAIQHKQEEDIFPGITLQIERFIKWERFFSWQFVNPDTLAVETIRFVSRENALLDGHEVPGDAAGSTPPFLGYVQTLVDHIKANRTLMGYYDVSYDADLIQLIAKRPIQELVPFNFMLNDETGSPGAYSVNQTIHSGYLKALKRRSHRIDIKVFFEREFGSNNFDLVAELTDTVNDNGLLNVDVHSILHSEIQNSFIEPPLMYEVDPLAANKTKKANIIRRYYIEAAEKWAGLTGDADWFKSDILFAHFGGVSLEDFTKNNPIQYLANTQNYLTWWKTGKRLYLNQSDWLSWMNTTGVTETFTIECEVRYKDATSDTLLIGTQELNPWETISFPVGYEQLNLAAADPTKEIYAWIINVINVDLGLSKSFKYLLNEKTSFIYNQLVYINSFGVPESFYTIGYWEKLLDTSKEIASKTLTHDYTNVNGQEFVFQNISRNSFKARSGSLLKKEAESLQATLTAAPVFHYTDGIFNPVIIEVSSTPIKTDEQILESFEFRVVKSLQMKNYSVIDQVPELEVVNNCGTITVNVIKNTAVASLSSISVYINDYDTLSETTAAVGLSYSLTEFYEENCTLLMKCTATMNNGDVHQLSIAFSLKKQRATFLSPDHITPGSYTDAFVLESNINQTGFVDFEFDDVNEVALTTGAPVLFFQDLLPLRQREISIEAICLEQIRLFMIAGQNYTQFKLQAMKNIEQLEIVNTAISGTMNLVPFKQLEEIILSGNLLTDCDFGLLRNMFILDLSDNLIAGDELLSIVQRIWNYRKLYTEPSITVYLNGNPGAAAPPAEFVEIVLGSGSYTGEGLNDYGITVIY